MRKVMMKNQVYYDFEKKIIELFDLSEGLIWCEIRLSNDRPPSIRCEYEVWDNEGNPVIDENGIKTIKEEFDVIINKKEKENEIP